MEPNGHDAMRGSPMPVMTEISHPLATIWLAREAREDATYFYGGTRLVDPATSDAAATGMLARLMQGESSAKNRLINWAIEAGALDAFGAELPPGFLESRVAGARCLIRPRSAGIAAALADPSHRDNALMTAAVLEPIGGTLNSREPRIKLTPDFGRYAGVADILHRYTPNVLGIRCEAGGCGGKSSYSVTGVLAGAERAATAEVGEGPVTCIGSAGAMGTGVLAHFLARGVSDLGACDLAYDVPQGTSVPAGSRHLKSRPQQFTAESLERGGMIVATTIGDELEHSPWEAIPPGTLLLLAHNLALPPGEKGIALAEALARHGVLVIPGQALTLGGALTARLEWYWRQLPSRPAFDKGLAHRVVHRLVSHLVARILAIAEANRITPYQSMLRLAGDEASS
jgi:hypothetical protein